jgi:uncharacterized membrane protein YukC
VKEKKYKVQTRTSFIFGSTSKERRGNISHLLKRKVEKTKEERGKRKEERGKRKEERGKRKEERGKRKEERGKRKEERKRGGKGRGKRKKITYIIFQGQGFAPLYVHMFPALPPSSYLSYLEVQSFI